MDYLEFTLNLLPGADPGIVIAILSESGFESFVESDDMILGYISEDSFATEVIIPVLEEMVEKGLFFYRYETIKSQNWNALWESNYDPVSIDGKCMIRAPFHKPVAGMQYDIVIEPKMSFGTAHHETTFLMIQLLMEESISGEKILDMGCGTGVLGILAFKMGAGEVVAIDNDDWAYKNALDNIKKNDAAKVTVIQGEAGDIPRLGFDLIMANINRNVLLRDIPAYAKSLKDHGVLLMSGFYEMDLSLLRIAAEDAGLHYFTSRVKNSWVCAKFVK
ncbi:MAG: 50S ribosomal protein L11 methyltransferase [Bacteroidales bacterium]|nr:50S ribosomal protein L11 methyltransferase [Bacteroidales bacterium]